MMYRGYVNLWRKSMESSVWHNDQLWKLWCYCLLKANHKPRWVSVCTGRGKTEEYVEAGQFIFGSKRAGRDLNQKWQSTYRRLKKLEKLEKLKTQSKTHYTIVTICNWEIYQSPKNKNENPNENQRETK